MTFVRTFLLPVAILLLLISAYVHFLSGNASDKNWLLMAAHHLLAGKKLYVDIFEINPPLIVWIYTVPVWISMHLMSFLADYNVLTLMGLALIAIVIGLSLCLIERHPAFTGQKGRKQAFALLLAYTFVFFTAPMYFWDREHILLVLTFPYVVRFMPAIARQALPLPLRLAVGVLAGIGFCIKPHALLLFGVLQLAYLIRERSLRIVVSLENLIIYLMGAAYLSLIVLALPEYLNTIVPMAMATYAAYSRKLSGISSIVIFTVIMGLTFADFRPRYKSPYRREIYYFLAVCAGYLAYAFANNGWSYTYNPLISMARIVTGWVLMEFIWLKNDANERGEPVKPFVFGARACGANLVLNALFYLLTFSSFFYTFDCEKSKECRSGSIFFREAKEFKARSFGAMSLEFYKWSELSRETGGSWDTRFNHLWMLPEFIIRNSADFDNKYKWITAYVGKAYADDLNRWKPEVLFVDASPMFFPKHPYFDLVKYYGAVPEFREALTHYRRDGGVDACLPPDPDAKPEDKGVQSDCRFDVYRRIPGS